MESNAVRCAFRCALSLTQNSSTPRFVHQSAARLAVPAHPQGEIRAAAPVKFTSSFEVSQKLNRWIPGDGDASENAIRGGRQNDRQLLRGLRVVPASASYFTALPKHTDDVLYLSSLLLKYQTLPTLGPNEAPPIKFVSRVDYQAISQERVREKGYSNLITLLRRLHKIHPAVVPAEVTEAIERYKALIQPNANMPKPILIDEWGRAKAIGRRKSSTAAVYLVEGEGGCLINGRSLSDYFGRLHDRESAVWALKATQRLDKYNVWALVKGGGTTGQAEAITLAVAKALLAHEPDLKPALRRAGVVTRNMKRVERKKPGKLKARKMPAWVKR